MHGSGDRIKRIEERTEALIHRVTGAAVRQWPHRVPPAHLLETCRIIAHRGDHDNRRRLENTLPAFDAAADAGVWGIELDIRWTRDLVPVVIHDPDTRRVFARETWVAATPLDRLKQHLPLIPTLAEVIARYGGRLHLMLEIKHEPYPRPRAQFRIMRRLLRDLAPGDDFHFMGLHPGMFDGLGRISPRAFVPIARLRIDRFSRMAAMRRWGGLAGHFLMTPRTLIDRHHRLGQGVGTGFADSPQCLFREIRRGVDWIFSNHAAVLQTHVRHLKSGV